MGSKLSNAVEDLAARVARLERMAPANIAPVPVDPGAGVVSYRGAGPWGDSTIAWDMTRGWEDITTAPPDPVARVLAALANPSRVRIVTELVSGPVSGTELASRLQFGTTGQLFHHLKELLAAGIVHQPRRGAYALRPQHVVALLTILSAADDLTAPTETAPTETASTEAEPT